MNQRAGPRDDEMQSEIRSPSDYPAYDKFKERSRNCTLFVRPGAKRRRKVAEEVVTARALAAATSTHKREARVERS